MGSYRGARGGRIAAVAAGLLLALSARAEAPKAAKAAAAPRAPQPLVQAQPPPFTPDIFPCTGCHDASMEKNAERRELAFHGEKGEPQDVFDHDSEHRWCLDCHDLQDRDVLRLASGVKVPYTESYRLCGQCHGDKYRDWRAGVHGKRVGRWDGEKTYFLCVNCHNPHTPRFKGVQEVTVDGKPTVAPTLTYLKPEPRPKRPQEQRQ